MSQCPAGKEKVTRAHVVLCLLPEAFVRRIDVPTTPDKGPRSRRRSHKDDEGTWHDIFKADAIQLARPVQVVRPAIYGGGVRRFTRDGTAILEMQDEATRAWNFFCALYYKAGGIPWRLARESTDLMTCYMGISFYHDPTSVEAMKKQPGKDMMIFGSGSIVSQLTQHDLIDEYQLVVCPIFLGSGRPLLSGVSKSAPLELLEARKYQSGDVLLRYGRLPG